MDILCVCLCVFYPLWFIYLLCCTDAAPNPAVALHDGVAPMLTPHLPPIN